MKITINVAQEVELATPHYFKLTYTNIAPSYYGVIDESKGIYFDSSTGVNIASPVSFLQFMQKPNYVPVQADEFFAAFEQAMSNINDYVTQTIEQ